jgi:signal recognition particle subunit SEC65
VGRGSAALFNATVQPVGAPPVYAESRRFGVIEDPRHQTLVQRLRSGQIICAVERRKRNPREPLRCPCGVLVQDPYHVVMECPHNHASRLAVYDAVQARAAKDSDLRGLMAHSMDSVLLASLGAPLPGVGEAIDGPLYTALIRSAAPVWATAFSHVLDH